MASEKKDGADPRAQTIALQREELKAKETELKAKEAELEAKLEAKEAELEAVQATWAAELKKPAAERDNQQIGLLAKNIERLDKKIDSLNDDKKTLNDDKKTLNDAKKTLNMQIRSLIPQSGEPSNKLPTLPQGQQVLHGMRSDLHERVELMEQKMETVAQNQKLHNARKKETLSYTAYSQIAQKLDGNRPIIISTLTSFSKFNYFPVATQQPGTLEEGHVQGNNAVLKSPHSSETAAWQSLNKGIVHWHKTATGVGEQKGDTNGATEVERDESGDGGEQKGDANGGTEVESDESDGGEQKGDANGGTEVESDERGDEGEQESDANGDTEVESGDGGEQESDANGDTEVESGDGGEQESDANGNATPTLAKLFVQAKVKKKGECAFVYNQVNLLLASVLHIVQDQLGIPSSQRVAVWDTQRFGCCDDLQPDQAICHPNVRPHKTVCAGYNEVQTGAHPDPDHNGKMGTYLSRLLDASPQLPHACGVLVTPCNVVFHKMVRDPDGPEEWPYKWNTSPEFTLVNEADQSVTDKAMSCLIHWAHQVVDAAAALEYSYQLTCGADAAKTVPVNGVLGRGATATVYGIDVDGQQCALKVLHPSPSAESSSLDKEIQTLEKVLANGEPGWCPKVVGKVYKGSDTGVRTGTGAGAGSPARGFAMTPITQPVTTKTITVSVFKELLDALFELHKNHKLCHRDVRACNIGLANGHVVLLDMGSCVELNSAPVTYHGCFHTASDAVLASLERREPAEATAASDVVAAVRTAYLLSESWERECMLSGVSKLERAGDESPFYTMKAAWEKYCTQAWKEACETAQAVVAGNQATYKKVVEQVSKLLHTASL